MLAIVSTPIGNLKDLTFRAVEILKSVDFICAEDTRKSQHLLKTYDIHKPLFSFHSHSRETKLEDILFKLKQGKSAALITDAGTPGISDPGWKLIHHAIERGISVVPIPGPSALLTALCGSGLPMDKFLYLGFLPLKKGRKTLFEKLQNEEHTVIFYESPFRLMRTLEDMASSLPSHTRVVIARELTKIHEEFIRGSFSSVLEILRGRPSIKGEIVVLFKV